MAALWLELQQRIASRSVHEVKNALNGVAVNLEVVRSRLARVGTEPSAVARYADAGAAQFETLTSLVEALLTLARPATGATDVLALLRPLVALLSAVVRPDGVGIEIAGTSVERGAAITSAGAETVRLALASALLAAVDARRDVRCRVDVDEEGSTIVRIGNEAEGPAPSIDSRVQHAVEGSGVTMERDAGVIRLKFTPPGGASNS